MSVTVSVNGAVTTARLAGEIDTYTVPNVRSTFEEIAVAPDALVVVDLRDVTFLDSSGLGAIIGLYDRVVAAGARLQLVCGDITLRLVRLMHLDQVIDVVEAPDVDVAPLEVAPAESAGRVDAERS
ncbi:STAS domain-containing protein [Terrabacter sp. Ter38]|uniref:STAS domain-containing protein n=1 Tax=Terrabacter sp. Ter38 TaxID=2926030 RepID=UPI002117AE6C|nr:STAS domain-containing protein [Terrabacter sp. Ter38]